MDLVIRVAEASDVPAFAALRDTSAERMREWLEVEGDRRTTWLAELAGQAVGLASLVEFRRMPRADRAITCWGYLSNMNVLEPFRGRGIGTRLLQTVVLAAEERGYARLVLSPSARAVPLYLRNGFVVPDEAAGEDRLLVRRYPADP
jgi:GNAT superfamily N-acetyltransferase